LVLPLLPNVNCRIKKNMLKYSLVYLMMSIDFFNTNSTDRWRIFAEASAVG